MNTALPALAALQANLNADRASTRTSQFRADAARTVRDRSAETAPGDSFSDLLREASQRDTGDSAAKTDSIDARRHESDRHRSAADAADNENATTIAPDNAAQPSAQTRADESAQATAAVGETAANRATGETTTTSATLHTQQSPGAAPDALGVQILNTAATDTAPNAGQSTDVSQVATANSAAPQPIDAAQNAQTPTGQNTAVNIQPVVDAATKAATEAPPAPSAAQSQANDNAANAAQHTARNSTTSPNNSAAPRSAVSTQQSQSNTSPNTATPAQTAASATQADAQTQPPQPASATDQLRRQVTQAIAQSHGEDENAGAAQRRAGHLNAQIGLENATGVRMTAADAMNATTSAAVSAHAAPLPGASVGQTAAQLLGSEQATSSAGLSAGHAGVDEVNFTGNVARGLSALVNQRGGVMHMRLQPPELGQLRIQMTIAGGAVTAHLQAADPQAQELLQRNIDSLRTALQRQGLTVERLTVQTHQASNSGNASGQTAHDQSHDQPSQQQHDHQHDAGDGASRGRDEHAPREQRRQRWTQTFNTQQFDFDEAQEALIGNGASP